jgi:hypothetical protein
MKLHLFDGFSKTLIVAAAIAFVGAFVSALLVRAHDGERRFEPVPEAA